MRTVLARRPSPEMELARANYRRMVPTERRRAASLRITQRLAPSQDSLDHLEEPLSAINFPSELQHMETLYDPTARTKRSLKTAICADRPRRRPAPVPAGAHRPWRRRSKAYITELNRLNQALKNRNKQTQLAIQLPQRKPGGLHAVAKDGRTRLRNPISAISSALNLLDRTPPADEKSRSSWT